jgi:hypothetical protein
LRFQALVALHHLVGTAALPEVRDKLVDSDADVRYIALRILEEQWQDREEAGAVTVNDFKRVRQALDDQSEKVRLAAAILLARAGDDSGHDRIVAAVNEAALVAEPEDEQAAVELAGELRLGAARPGLARRAWGFFGLFGNRFAFQARVSLAKLGDRRAIDAIRRGLDAWSRDTRTLNVVAAGQARLQEVQSQLLAMQGDPRRADPDAVEEALSALRADDERGP